MIRLSATFETQEEKEKLLQDISNLQNHKIHKLTKEYPGKGKSLYKRIYIDLIHK